ncbi:autotransporter outer membrane beta-barrel domain-containing protein [Phascolarctobacterium faecium]|uniref:autotransporter outer membrane beta-barrel domain-containing protein n=1 Tax=Phascolarctobacterium faecium TaxID=33025 RepID=UPI00265F6076|nr:autotransporter outer membrane beta-barrel domain-containing protein [Phascolarctobacterium faecium]
MKKHKRLSSQELMTGQDIPCVHLGGKFVALDAESEACQSVSRKKQAEKILATVVMGMNLVNTVAPLTVLATAEQKMSVVPQPVRSEAEPLDYAVLPQLADVVEKLVFARAYATDYDGNASVAVMHDGDTQNNYSGQNAIVSTMSGGHQEIGGTGTVSTMSGGSQSVKAGGTGTVSAMISGRQNIEDNGTIGIVITMSDDGQQTINFGGTGTVSTMNGGVQVLDRGGTGTVDVMNSGVQGIDKGTGTVNTMNNGSQIVRAGGNGIVGTMEGGSQTISSGGNGTVVTMNSGWQNIDYGGTGTINTMSGGQQTVKSGGAGTIGTMSSGMQEISSGGTGTVVTMTSGEQNIYSDGTGTVSTMNDGGQYITSGTGTISTMSGGYQEISSGTGTVSTMSGGEQNIYSGGTGTISTMSGGLQLVENGGSGIVSTLSGGTQMIVDQGSGTIGTMSGGLQEISSGGMGTVDTMTSGSQTIASGGTGTVSTMSGGQQSISSGGTGTVSTVSGGLQFIENGGGTISSLLGGKQDINGIGGTGTVSTMSGGTQYINYGGMGTISTMNGGTQYLADGSGTIGTMNGGKQIVELFGGIGIIDVMISGEQLINQNGIGTISSLLGGTQALNSGGTALDTVIAGGTQQVSVGAVISGATLSAGIQQVYDGTNLNNITFAGGTQAVMSGAAVSGMQVANGVQSVASGGSAAATVVGTDGSLQLSSGGIVSSLTLTSGSLELENIDGGSFTVSGTLTANNAVINMVDGNVTRSGTPVYETLTIDKLSGSGTTFVMDTDLAGETNSDKITITDADTNATHYVQIKDLSKLNNIEVTGAHQQLLITDNSGKLTFEGKEFNAGGLWDVDPTLAKQGNDWYLTKLEKTANNDTRVLLDAADNSYALWRNTNDSLRSRLGALASGSELSDGIWARTQAGRFSGDNYEGRYNLYQLGFDQATDAKSVYGAAVDYGDGTGSYDNGSGKDKLKSFSLYGVWTGDNGAYTNVTARYGMVSTDLESYGDFPDKAEYKQHAYSVSVEYGKRFDMERGFFIEPNAQFTLGRLGSIDYTTDRGANGYIEGMNSAIGRIGFVMGQKITGDSDIYLKADLLHEFAGERDLQLTSDAGGTSDMLTKHNDYGDTWFELGLGANIKVSKAASIYGEIERGFGGDINKKWSVNGGVRFTF